MECSFIGGGAQNTVSGSGSFLGGGGKNTIRANSPCGFIGGGEQNIIDSLPAQTSNYSAIGGGLLNCIKPGSNCASIFGGAGNFICGDSSFIGGGVENCSYGLYWNTVGGGGSNVINTVEGGNTIAGGVSNCIMGVLAGGYSGIASGSANLICEFGYSFIGGGSTNCINGAMGTIGGGSTNYIYNGEHDTITGGADNRIGNIATGFCSHFSVVAGGRSNIIDAANSSFFNSDYNVISGGYSNYTGPASNNSAIVGGYGNNLRGNCSMIGGGLANCIGSNVASNPAADFAFIGGGCNNWIDSSSGASTFGVIGGGEGNYLAPGIDNSSIFSGQKNSVASSCSSILGGAGNSIPAGFPNAHIAGSNITLSAGVTGNPNSFHVNGLWANGLPVYSSLPTGLPTGTVYQGVAGGGVIPGAKLLYIV